MPKSPPTTRSFVKRGTTGAKSMFGKPKNAGYAKPSEGSKAPVEVLKKAVHVPPKKKAKGW